MKKDSIRKNKAFTNKKFLFHLLILRAKDLYGDFLAEQVDALLLPLEKSAKFPIINANLHITTNKAPSSDEDLIHRCFDGVCASHGKKEIGRQVVAGRNNAW